MPTNLPARIAPRSRAADAKETIQTLSLFYFGMALIALLLVSSEQYFGAFAEQTIMESVLQATPPSLLIDQNGQILLPTSP